MFKFLLVALQIFVALSFSSFTPKANAVEQMEVITVYGSRYDFDYAWFWMGYHYNYPYDDFVSELNIDKEIALFKACNEVNANKPDSCGDKPTQMTQPRTDGCTNSPDYPFLGACNSHDICYDNLGSSKSSCDTTFKSNMQEICDIEYPSTFGNKTCRGAANTYYAGVVIGGGDAYYDSQLEADCAAWWSTYEQTCAKVDG